MNYTDTDPIEKTKNRLAFFDLDICKLTTIGIGIEIMSKSTITPKTAVALNIAVRSMQTPSVIVRSHPIAIGLQENIDAKKMPTEDPTVTNMANHTEY